MSAFMEGLTGRYSVCVRPLGGPFRTVAIAEAHEVEVVAAKYSTGHDVWSSAQPIAGVEVGRGTSDDVSALSLLYADLDLKPGGLPSEETVELVISDLSAILGQRPGCRVLTGHGVQPRWIVEGGEFRSDADRTAGQALLRRFGRLVARCARDRGGEVDAVFDLPRVLRVPGTMNVGKGDAVPVTLVEDTGGPLTLEELRERPSTSTARRLASDSLRRGERVNIADALAGLPVGAVPCASVARPSQESSPSRWVGVTRGW